CEAGELTHRPELAAITRSMDAAGVGSLTGVSEILLVGPVLRQVGLRVHAADRVSRNGGEARVTVLVDVGSRRGADRLLRPLIKSWGKRLLRPVFLRFRWMAAFEDVFDGRSGDGVFAGIGHGEPLILRGLDEKA